MLARRGRTRPRLLLSLAYAGYSGRDLALTWTAASGHEDAFPRPRLSARNRFSQGTFAGTRGNGRDAPLPAIHHAITIGEVRPTWRRRALPWSGGHTVDGILLLGIADIFLKGKTASDGLSGSGSAAPTGSAALGDAPRATA
jgi:hypothetical protein